jgi:hypothetical protein
MRIVSALPGSVSRKLSPVAVAGFVRPSKPRSRRRLPRVHLSKLLILNSTIGERPDRDGSRVLNPSPPPHNTLDPVPGIGCERLWRDNLGETNLTLIAAPQTLCIRMDTYVSTKPQHTPPDGRGTNSASISHNSVRNPEFALQQAPLLSAHLDKGRSFSTRVALPSRSLWK